MQFVVFSISVAHYIFFTTLNIPKAVHFHLIKECCQWKLTAISIFPLQSVTSLHFYRSSYRIFLRNSIFVSVTQNTNSLQIYTIHFSSGCHRISIIQYNSQK